MCSNLVHDIDYQTRLRRDFVRRRLHPSLESMVWAYHLGRPKEQVEMTGTFTMNQRLEAERQLIRSTLDPAELEQLAAQSQRLLDDALARARAKRVSGTIIIDAVAAPSQAPVTPADPELPEASTESGTDARTTSRDSE